MGGDLHLAPYLLWYGWLTFLVPPHGSVGRVERSERVVNGCERHLTYLPTDLILVKVVENGVVTQNVCIFGDGRGYLLTRLRQ